MSLRILGRKAKMEILQQNGDVCELLFNNSRAQHACRLFLNELKVKHGFTRAEFSRFAMDLQAGRVEVNFRYSYRQV